MRPALGRPYRKSAQVKGCPAWQTLDRRQFRVSAAAVARRRVMPKPIGGSDICRATGLTIATGATGAATGGCRPKRAALAALPSKRSTSAPLKC